ncbi:MAG: hypothetical protein JWR27_3105 [Aeromicrobium sp.]|nr:hypothetical protein [Aeromicrobium sp.]MCW2788176.1 hypothetical protein [Aeromicrobium sp.]
MEEKLLKRVRAFAHVDDRERADAYRRILADSGPRYDDLSGTEQRLARMLFSSPLWRGAGGHNSYGEGFAALRAEQAVRDELSTVVDLSFDAARHQTFELGGTLAQLPLKIHARYQLEEVLAGIDYVSFDLPSP